MKKSSLSLDNNTNEKRVTRAHWGTNGMGYQFDLCNQEYIGRPKTWGTSGIVQCMGDEWVGGPMGWGTNERIPVQRGRQAICLSQDDPAHWRINATRGVSELTIDHILYDYFTQVILFFLLGRSLLSMTTSSNGNIFRVTGHLCWEFTGHWWILRTKTSDAELWYFLWPAPK